MSITLNVTENSGSEVLVGQGAVLQLSVQELVGGIVQAVAGVEVTVREETAVSQAVVIETEVSSASLSDLLLIREDTEAARADAEASEAAALAHKNAAATSEANALNHKNAADSSKTAAAGSATAAATSEANALSHKNAADSSKTAAAVSATAAATSEANAISHKNAAGVSATAAATSEANALSHKNAADSSKAAATASATAAANSEANALSHKNAAGSSATAAAASATTAAASEANALSHKNAADSSKTAAAASAAQAQQYAAAVSSALIFRGGWSAAGGTYPTPSMNPETSDYYRITVGGTMTGAQGNITVTAGDYLHWDMTMDQWFKIDAVDAVTSVAGRTGDVTLTKTDVGLANVPNTDATNASNITSGTLDAARLPAALTGLNSIGFTTDSTDSASISTFVSGSNTYFDFNLSDDPTQNDTWRWRFTPSGGTVFSPMELDVTSNTQATLTVAGTVASTNVNATTVNPTRVTGVNQAAGDVRGNLGTPTVEETALFHGMFSNKLRFIPPISQEESTDGTNWVASTRATANQLGDLMLGEGQTTGVDVIPTAAVGIYGGYRLTWDATVSGYVFLNHLYIYCDTRGNNVTFTVEQYNNNTSIWDATASGTMNNWTGHVSIKHATIPFKNTDAGKYGKVRVTFSTTHNANTNVFWLGGIEWFGGYPAGRRNVQSYDRDKNVYFPNGIRAAGNTVWHAGNDGAASGLDADLLDGQQGSFYQDAGNITTGTLDKARLPVTINAATTGNAATATKLATARKINGVLFDGSVDITIADDTKLPSGANAVSATKLATARTINGVAFDGTANITVADSTKLPLTGGVLTVGLCIGDGTAAKPNDAITGGLEHYLELRGTSTTYPLKTGVVFHQEGISTSALVHGNTDNTSGYFDLITDDTNLSVRVQGQEIWNQTEGLKASKAAAGVTGNYTNWDSLTLHGVYKINSPDFVGDTNPPPSTYGYGILHTDVAEFVGEARIMQIYYPHNSDYDRYFYQRMRNSGAWTAWAKIWRGGTGPNSGLVSSKVSDIAPTGEGRNLVEGQMATDDYFRIRAYSTAYDLGEVEIATADGGDEPIHVRQYTGMFASVARTLTLLDGWGITQVPLGVNCTNGYGYPAEGSIGNGISGGNGDNANSKVNNLRVSSWWGIGFSPSVSGQAVPYMEYSHWFNVRNGSAGMRGALSQNSDIRLKENIQVIQDALAKTCTLRGIVYDRKDGGGRSTGVIAQEVQAVLPEAVTAQEDEIQTLSVAYGNMVGLLIEAIKELKEEVDDLKAEIAILKSA